MTQTTANAGNVVTKFLNEAFLEYVRQSRFSKYQGKSSNNVIVMKEGRKICSIPLVAKLAGAGVSGSSALSGSEEALANYAKTLTPTYFRNAVVIDNEEREKTAIDLFKEAKPALMNWAKEKQRDDIIQAMGAVYNGTVYADYGDAAAGVLDTWNTNNADRILYGSAKGNTTAGDHTASLGTIDTTNDKLTAATVKLAKRMAKQANPLIAPIKTKDDEDWFVYFVDSYGFRDLSEDATIIAANKDARVRGMDNPLFTGGDLVYDGVIIREIEEITTMIDGTDGTDGVWGGDSTADGLNDAGASSSRVGVGFLCGQQAVGYGLGQAPAFRLKKEDDYEFQNGVGIELKHDIDKMFFNDKQHGMVTTFFSATADA